MSKIDHKKLALIHIIKKELKLTDQEYRDILFKSAGVRSSKDLDEQSFKKLMNYFIRSQHYKINAHGLTLKQRMYIQSLARALHWDHSHLNNFIHKYYHCFELSQLTKSQASHLIESLKHTLNHQTESFKE
ncbi:MAG: DUF1018 domain-containing protein [Candidatus Omnitrophica bacterium]|nr:DUF1018 domain-containing protein [Candidatus Omnitrophota bacterium]